MRNATRWVRPEQEARVGEERGSRHAYRQAFAGR
jgi:hypothetical protein